MAGVECPTCPAHAAITIHGAACFSGRTSISSERDARNAFTRGLIAETRTKLGHLRCGGVNTLTGES